MRKILLIGAAFMSASAFLAGDTITLPAAASIIGGAPFFSDVRAFNTSYTDSLNVTATYRCFIAAIGTSCPTTAPQSIFTLAPRESKAFDDIVALTFLAPNTAGGVEFDFDAPEQQLVVTSRLFSTAPVSSVGMFIPGMGPSDAQPTTVLTSIQNGDNGRGNSFRTNVGVFNPGAAGVDVTFTLFDSNGAVVGAPVPRSVPAHSGLQVSAIFSVAGVASTATVNGVIVVSATGPVFSYAAVIDNATTDPIFVSGAPDQPLQAFTPAVTGTPSSATPTPTVPAPTPTQTPSTGGTRTVQVGPGGTTSFVDPVSGTSTTTISAGTTVMWVWNSGHDHSTTSGTCTSFCNPDGLWDSGIHSDPHNFSRAFPTAGTFHYFCMVHDAMMTGTVVVNP